MEEAERVKEEAKTTVEGAFKDKEGELADSNGQLKDKELLRAENPPHVQTANPVPSIPRTSHNPHRLLPLMLSV